MSYPVARMASPGKEAVIPRPTVLSPVSPAELLTNIITHHRHPSTVIIGTTQEDFMNGLRQDVLPPAEPTQVGIDEPPLAEEPPPPKHALLINTLLQIAVSRHIRVVFLSSVTHVRAWMTVFSPSESHVSAPPASQPRDPPSLVVYGLVALHRDTSEWSAQGIGASTAIFVEACVRHGFRAVLVEPEQFHGENIGASSEEPEPAAFGTEKLPLLKGMAMKEDGTWAGRTVELHRILGRWFDSAEKSKS